jgi:transposase
MIAVPPDVPRPSLDSALPQPILNTVVISPRVVMRSDQQSGLQTLFVGGIPFFVLHRDDEHSLRYLCVQLRLQGLAQQLELAAAFGHDRITQYRWEKKFEEEGLAGLAPYRPEGRPVSLPSSIEETVVKLHEAGLGMRRISSQLGLTLGVVRGVYERRSLQAHSRSEQASLYGPAEDVASEVEATADPGCEAEEPTPDAEVAPVEDRSVTEWEGLLEPEYKSEQGVAYGGVLLALPLLARFGVIEVFKRVYVRLSLLPLYGLETLVTLMVLMALLRIKRPEHLKGHPPVELGKPLGMPRAPEVKTVRRKLGLLGRRGLATEAMMELGRIWLEQEEDLLGFLYVDGHVRVYSGSHDLAKGFSVQRHMPVRATTDVWANDRRGDPVFVVTSEVNESLSQMLEPVLAQARQLVGVGRAITVIFDRGGWSPQLFVELVEAGFDLVTYRKGKTEDLPVEAFTPATLTVEGTTAEYLLHDQDGVQVGGAKLRWAEGPRRPLLMRQVTKLSATGHQTQVLTTRRDLLPAEVLWRMFNRWRQENFFKYMRQEFDLDALVEYGAIPVSPELDRPNPEWLAATTRIKALRARIEQLQGQRCELVGDPDAIRDAPPGFERFVPAKPKAKELLTQIAGLKGEAQELEALRADLSERVTAGDLERLAPERKLLTNLFKVIAYRVETELLRTVAPHYARSEDDGRKLVASALASAADFEVTDRELRVTLAPQSSPHRSKAIQALCSSLNEHPTVVPGTTLRLVLACAQNPPADVASPS